MRESPRDPYGIILKSFFRFTASCLTRNPYLQFTGYQELEIILLAQVTMYRLIQQEFEARAIEGIKRARESNADSANGSYIDVAGSDKP